MNDNNIVFKRTSVESLKDDMVFVLDKIELVKYYTSQKPVFLKINGNFDKPYPGSNTSPWFLDYLLLALRQFNFKEINVVEGDLPDFRAKDMIKKTRLIRIIEKHGANFIPYEDMERDENNLPALLKGGQLINLPVPHGHGIALISCATKNLFGLLPKDRRIYHKTLSETLLMLGKLCTPCLTIVDGTVSLIGESTRRGTPLKTDFLIGGWNIFNIDVVIAEVMGYANQEVPFLKLASKKGLISNFSLIGDIKSLNELPRYQAARTKLSFLRKTAMFLEDTFLFNIPFFLWIEDRMRRVFHHYNFYKKKNLLFSGVWISYLKEWEKKRWNGNSFWEY